MMAFVRPWLFSCAAIAALTAQTPAPPAAPVRHLQYSFAVHYESNEGGSFRADNINRVSGCGVSAMAGVGCSATTPSAGGRRGTLDVEVTGFTPDGALIITVQETLFEAARPGERFTCTVYGDGHIMCPNADGPPTDAENLLMSMLGRGFIDASVSDTNARWQRRYDGKQVTVVTDYTIASAGDGRHANIAKHSQISSHVRTVGDTVENGNILYDVKLSVPDGVTDETAEQFGGATYRTTFDFHLISDSFANRAPAGP